MRVCPYCRVVNNIEKNQWWVSAVFNGYAASNQTSEVAGCGCKNCGMIWTEVNHRDGTQELYPSIIFKAEEL